MINGRCAGQGGGSTKYECDFKHDASTSVSAKFKAGLQEVGLNVGGSKQEHMAVKYHFVVEFWA